MRDYSPRRRQRRCRACGIYIGAHETPWIAVSITGEESAWHVGCNDDGYRRGDR
jgi:hypothetical protein